ncbi:hypothetical protein CYY_006248 [Polysphondylium violaceum]|uniref:UBX domain-containing protein n=1 Tax=Polysphondylium violaceum TaxID=133409 RepID=A0A8J4URM2_9MYCE|nr:hypothetical protein CYY_006248 [Polysphondylium violaceum]
MDEISFDVLFGDSPLPITLDINATVADLKSILEMFTGVPADQQMLVNLSYNNNESAVLASLDLKNVEMVQVPPSSTTAETAAANVVDLTNVNNDTSGGGNIHPPMDLSDDDIDDIVDITTPTITTTTPTTTTTTTGYVPSPYATNFFPEVNQLSAQNLIDFLDQLSYPEFSEDFFEQFSVVLPQSFSGSYKEALAAAKRQGKLVLTYLHSDNDLSLNFCLDILRSEEMVEFINENYVFWTARITPEAESFLFSLIQFESYPILAIISNTSSPQIVEVIQGVSDKDQIYNKLVNETTARSDDLAKVKAEEEVNERDRIIVQEQDQAYQESLRADKEKQQKAEEERQRIEDKKNEKISRGDLVPTEPPKGPNTTQIIFKLPDDSKVERRFSSNEKLEMLCNFLDGNGCEIENYQFVTQYPKKVFTKADFNQTLKDAGLSPQSILNVRSNDD